MEGSRPHVRRRGRVLDRLVGLAVALTVGVLLGARFGPVAAVLGALAALLLVGALLRRVRRSRLATGLYLALLAAGFVLGAVASVRHARYRAAGPVRAAGSVATGAPGPFAAGLATASFELPARATLAGWGTAPRRAALPAYGGLGAIGRLALAWMGPPTPGAAPRVPVFHRPSAPGGPIGAKALVLRPPSGPPLGLVRLDLVLLDADLARRVLDAVADLGFVPATLLVQASHTHSGPGGTLRAPLAEALGTDHFDVVVRDAVVSAAASALREAYATARPARLVARTARDRGANGLPGLARTRGRHADLDPEGDAERIDARVLALRFDAADTGAPLALLVHYAVQPVVVRPRDLRFDADLPGAIEDAIEARLDVPVLFLNGHCGDVTPRRDGLSGPEGAHRLAARFADVVADDLGAPAPGEAHLAFAAARCVRDLGTPHAIATLGSREAFEQHVVGAPFGRDAPQAFAAALSLPVNAALGVLGLPEVRVGFTFAGAAGVTVDLGPSLAAGDAAAGAVLLEGDAGVDAVLLWHPAVATQALLRRWREAAVARDLPVPFVLGTTNGAMGYLVTRDEYAAGRYEALASLYGSDGARDVEAMLLEAIAAARAALPGP